MGFEGAGLDTPHDEPNFEVVDGQRLRGWYPSDPGQIPHNVCGCGNCSEHNLDLQWHPIATIASGLTLDEALDLAFGYNQAELRAAARDTVRMPRWAVVFVTGEGPFSTIGGDLA
ncbi:uncharacterized protein METZ01_LOCUS334446 [marine metagenome]|uniref:Uncharacterized protein n=1 Tax=marine metagenome TaxID=408172 RepID=A0A382QAL6_9ZZZZ